MRTQAAFLEAVRTLEGTLEAMRTQAGFLEAVRTQEGTLEAMRTQEGWLEVVRTQKQKNAGRSWRLTDPPRGSVRYPFGWCYFVLVLVCTFFTALWRLR